MPGHERLASQGVVFENHQIASNVCTPSRTVIYTGQHIQNKGMFDNTDLPGEAVQSGRTMMRLNREPNYALYRDQWDVKLPQSRSEAMDAPGRPACHGEFRDARGALIGVGIADNTIVIYTADHGEMTGAHGLSGKGANAYRENNNVPFIISHPAYKGNMGTMLTPLFGVYVSGLTGIGGDKSLDWGASLNVRFVY